MADEDIEGIMIEIEDEVKSTSSFQEDLIEVDMPNSSINASKTELSNQPQPESDLHSRRSPHKTESSEESFLEVEKMICDPHVLLKIEDLQNKVAQREDKLRRHYLYTSKDVKFLSRFNDIKFQPNSATILDSQNFYRSEYFGVFTVFWVIIGLYIMSALADVYYGTTKPLQQWVVIGMFKRDLFKVAVVDSFMYLSSYFPFFLQVACKWRIISWNNLGWIIQAVYNLMFGVFWTVLPLGLYLDLPWIARIFIVLHCFVFIMKMHSYGHYNGYLWNIYNEGLFSETQLKTFSDYEEDLVQELSIILEQSLWYTKHELEFQSNGTTEMKDHHRHHFKDADVNKSIATLQKQGIIKFPANVNLKNYFDYTMFPTLVYTLNFPRTRSINWTYVAKKTCGTFALIFSMVIVAEESFCPLMQEVVQVNTLPVPKRFSKYLLIFSHMILPLGKQYLLSFILIWNEILNGIAELSRFGDRHFYGAWWSSVDYMDYSRKWNTIVHRFLRRHVYNSSINGLGLSKPQAAMLTLLLSATVHEWVMYIVFGKLRGYLFLLMLFQIPLTILVRSNSDKSSRVWGNTMFWLTYVSGPSLISTFYLLF